MAKHPDNNRDVIGWVTESDGHEHAVVCSYDKEEDQWYKTNYSPPVKVNVDQWWERGLVWA